MLDPEDRDAVLLNIGIKESDYRVVVEFACIYNPEEFLGVKRAYQNRFKRSLEEDLAQHTNGDVRQVCIFKPCFASFLLYQFIWMNWWDFWVYLQLLVALASPYKYGGGEINVKLAESEAEELENTMKKKHFNHEEVIRILTTRSNAQIVATLNNYKDNHGTAITKVLSIKFSTTFW